MLCEYPIPRRPRKRTAALWEKGGAYAQAATAWVNLGILCGEQGRLEESLQWYEKVRRVRQADPGTTHARLGSLANNIANLYRRMKNFELATREVEDAIRLLQGDPLLAHAYGTYGLILQDQGFDDPAVEWFRKSRVEHARHPSPNVARLSEALGNEAGALRRLGRSREAAVLERQRVELQGEVPALRAVPAISKLVAGEAGEVRIELDGIHLAPEVYRDCDLATFENRLEEVLERGDYGELDGHETGPETTTVFLYGADAKALFGAVEPVLRDYPLCQGARVTIRQDGRERQIVISA